MLWRSVRAGVCGASACLLALLAGPVNSAQAALWPERFGTYTKASAKPAAVTGQALWDEYGLEDAEQAEYASGKQRFTAIAYRFNDTTGALAAFQWQRPADARPSDLGQYAAETPDAVVLMFGNYLFRFEGRKPEIKEMATLLDALPLLDQSALPTLSGSLPDENLVPNSQRFVVGPTSLARFEPRIAPSVAGFHFGAEAQLGRYRINGAEMGLAIFSYPTPQIARERVLEFEKLPGAIAKRSGPLVAVILSPPDADAAEKVLSRVRYQATLSWSEYTPSRRDNIGDLIVTAFMLTGILLVFCFVAGLAFAGLQAILRFRFRGARAQEPMITLHLTDW